MRHYAFFIFLLAGLVTSPFPIPDEAVDFNAYDITGTTHNLFSYLISGKYVLIDFTRKEG